MALNKITNKEIEEKQVASLPDRMTGTAAENKAAFDALTKALIAKYNELIDTLMGQGGAAAIGSEPFAGVGDAATVRDQLIQLQDNIAGAVSGSIPDASITEAKLADNAVSAAKIADGAVTAAKIADSEIVNEKIRDLTIKTSKLANEAVTDAKLAADAVSTEKIADGAVTENKLAASAIEAVGAGKAKIQTGTYNGTGTSGTNSPVSLTFGFVPKIVFIFANEKDTVNSKTTHAVAVFNCMRLTSAYKTYGYHIMSATSGGWYNDALFAKLNGTTLTWYTSLSISSGGEDESLNSDNVGGYSYIALG